MLARPLVAGACWSLVTGSWTTGFGVAFFFELLWLDSIPVGTFVPPVSLFPAVASLSLVSVLGVQHPSEIFLVLAATTPFAGCMAFLESRQRIWQNKEFNLLVQGTRRKNAQGFAPGELIGKGLFSSLLIQAVACFGLLILLTPFLAYLFRHTRIVPWISWPILWLIASIGGLTAMRFRHARTYTLGVVLLIGLILWAGLLESLV